MAVGVCSASVLLMVGLSVGVAVNTSPSGHVNFLSDEYIANLNNQDLPWKAGRNFPADLTQAELERIVGSKPSPGALPEFPAPHERRKSYGSGGLRDTPIPKEFDSRQYFKNCSSIISVIPDQGSCASSYAFAIASVASDRLCISSHGKVKKLLSAEYITACCKMCRYPNQNTLCSSGLSSATWAWVHKRGLVTGGGYKSNIGCQPVSFPPCNHSPHHSSTPSCKDVATPKPKCHTRCTNDRYSHGFFQDKYRFKKYYWVSEQVPNIQREIMEGGPVVANIYIYSDLLSYKSGVYTVSADASIVTYASVKIVGWGEEDGRPYWSVVSTFGREWGNEGTFRILRGRNEVMIENLVIVANPRGNFDKAGHVRKGWGVDVVDERGDVDDSEQVGLEWSSEENEDWLD